MHRAGLVVAHASVLTDGLREHADVVFPAESYAEKEGTVVHPDGRLQRLRTAIAHPGEVRSGWSVIADIALRCGLDLGVLTQGMAWKQLAEVVPFYAGVTLEEIGGRGVRWPERDEAKGLEAATPPPTPSSAPETGASFPGQGQGQGEGRRAGAGEGEGRRAGEGRGDGEGRGQGWAAGPAAAPDAAGSTHSADADALRLGRYRPIWAAPEVEISPALHFAIASQQVELSPEDARRLSISSGDEVTVAQNGTRLRARAQVRSGVPEGTSFLADGIESDSANALTEPTIHLSKP